MEPPLKARLTAKRKSFEQADVQFRFQGWQTYTIMTRNKIHSSTYPEGVCIPDYELS